MKKSFLLHIDSLCILDDLTDEQAGQLFNAIYQFQLGNELELSPMIKIAFSQFKNQFNRDAEKYEKTCEARKLAGSKGGKQKVANANKSKQKVANLADKDNKNKKDSDNESDKDNIDMLENEFQACWKDYTLSFLKLQGRNGGVKSKALANYNKLRKKYQHEDILNLIENHKSLKIGHKDLERLLREDMIKQFLEEGNIITSIVPKDLIGKKYKVDGVVIEFTSKGYNKVEQDWLVTNPQNIKDMIEAVRSAS